VLLRVLAELVECLLGLVRLLGTLSRRRVVHGVLLACLLLLVKWLVGLVGKGLVTGDWC
jgi:hypothetical protein